MVAPRSPAPLGPAVLPAVLTSPVPVLFLSPPSLFHCHRRWVAQSPNGESSIGERSVKAPRHGRGHGPKVAALDRRGNGVNFVEKMVEKVDLQLRGTLKLESA